MCCHQFMMTDAIALGLVPLALAGLAVLMSLPTSRSIGRRRLCGGELVPSILRIGIKASPIERGAGLRVVAILMCDGRMR